MTIMLFAIAVGTLCMPRWLSPLTRRLDPRDAVRVCVAAVVVGSFLVELSFILLAVPAVMSAVGIHSIAERCRFLDTFAPAGLHAGWLTAALAVLFPVLFHRGWRRARTAVDEMRAGTELGIHQEFEGIDLVLVPTDRLVAYSIGHPNPQIVVSEGLIALLTAEELDVVVRHEVAHVRKGHGRILRFLSALEHPMPSLHRINGSVRTAMERSADEEAIRRNPVRRMALLDALLKISDSDVPELVAAFTHESGVVERATALLDAPPAPTRTHRVAAGLTVGGAPVAGAVVVGAWVLSARACFL